MCCAAPKIHPRQPWLSLHELVSSHYNAMTTGPRRQVPQFRFPEPIITTTTSGARILMVPMESATTVSLAVFAREGYSTEPIGGLASITASLLVKGTQHHSEEEFARTVDRLGASVHTLSSSKQLGVSIVGLPEHTRQLIALVAECILEPAFDSTELEKTKTKVLASFPLMLSQSSYRARRIFSILRFPEHPLSRPSNGTPSSVASIEREHIEQWYHQILRSSCWHVLMIGAFDPEDVRAQLVQSFAPLGDHMPSQLPPIPDPPPAIGVGQGLMTDQVELRLGMPAVPYISSDYPAAVLVSTAFAGHFRSRINLLVREHEGLTYGAYGGMSAGKHAGTFVLSTSTTPANLSRMMDLLLHAWERLATEPFTDQELHAARQFLYGTFWQSIETPDSIASIAIELALNDLPSNFYEQLLARLEQLTPSELLPVQQTIFAPERLIVAAVGERDHLQQELARFGTPRHVVLAEEQQ